MREKEVQIRDSENTMMRLSMLSPPTSGVTATFYSLVDFNNIAESDSIFRFVRHVMMDSAFPEEHGQKLSLAGTV
jgi:predicted small integral membrane protein